MTPQNQTDTQPHPDTLTLARAIRSQVREMIDTASSLLQEGVPLMYEPQLLDARRLLLGGSITRINQQSLPEERPDSWVPVAIMLAGAMFVVLVAALTGAATPGAANSKRLRTVIPTEGGH